MHLNNFTISQKKFIFLSIVFIALFTLLGFTIERHETLPLLSAYALLFVLYCIIYTTIKEERINQWVCISIVVRVLLLFALPHLSDDFYRFIWDGRLLQEGLHPFAEIPSHYMNTSNAVLTLTPELFQQLNSKEYFTIYPPIAQFIFWFATFLFPTSITGSVITMKLLIVLAEVGTLVMLKKLLVHFELPAKNILLYALNPLIIIELTGNLHFEAFVIFFLIASVYLLLKEKQTLSALFFSFAVCVKLLPLIFLPSLLPYLGIRKASIYYSTVFLISTLLFSPLIDVELIKGLNESVGYYFKKFEFNASIYYLVRAWGFWKYDYNIIQTVGWKLGLISAILILFYSFRQGLQKQSMNLTQNLALDWMIALVIYLLFTTTVHPWYIAPLVAFCVLSNSRFPILWSLLIFGTYIGYTTISFHENLWITAVEYVLVLLLLSVELRKRAFAVNH